MKKLVLFVSLFVIIFTGSSFAQSLRVGPAVGFHIPQDISILGANNINYDFGLDSDMHYGLKAKLSLPGINLSAHILKFTVGGDFSYEQDILSIGIGTEMKLIPGPLNVYLAGDFLISSFEDFSFNIGANNVTGSGETRYGLGFGAGIDTSLFPFADLDLSVKYYLHNLIGKEDNEESFNTLNITASFLFSLL